jgi:hypothetical protein
VKTRSIPTTLKAALARAGVRLGALRVAGLDQLGHFGSALRATLGTSVPATPKQPAQMSISSSAFGTSWSIENNSTCFALNGYEDRMKPGGASA